MLGLCWDSSLFFGAPVVKLPRLASDTITDALIEIWSWLEPCLKRLILSLIEHELILTGREIFRKIRLMSNLILILLAYCGTCDLILRLRNLRLILYRRNIVLVGLITLRRLFDCWLNWRLLWVYFDLGEGLFATRISWLASFYRWVEVVLVIGASFMLLEVATFVCIAALWRSKAVDVFIGALGLSNRAFKQLCRRLHLFLE